MKIYHVYTLESSNYGYSVDVSDSKYYANYEKALLAFAARQEEEGEEARMELITLEDEDDGTI